MCIRDRGDPLAFRPNACTDVNAELEKLPDTWVPEFAMNYGDTIHNTIAMAVGDTRILASSKENAALAHAYLRGDDKTVRAGDAVLDLNTKTRARVALPQQVRVGAGCGRSVAVTLDDGRVVPACALVPRVVEYYTCIGSGECDTLVLLPDVGTQQTRSAVRRVRSLVLGVGWHPRCHLI